MKKFMENKLLKLVTVITILITMIVPYFPKLTNAEEPENTEYVRFNANCKVNGKVSSGQPVAFGFDFDLKGIQTGFKNVKLLVEDRDTGKPIATITADNDSKIKNTDTVINSGRFSTVNYGNVQTGTSFSGTVNVTFGDSSTFEDYTKKIKFTFEADYRDPKDSATTVHAREEREVEVTVTKADTVDKFSSNVKITQNRYDSSLGEEILGNEYLGAHYVYKTADDNYAIDQVKASYNVNIKAHNVTYGKYVLTVTKTPEFKSVTPEETNSERNLIIDLSNVPSQFTTNIDRKSDGNTDIILTYKEKKDSYQIEDMEADIDFNFNIVVTYKIYFSYTIVVPVTSTITSTETETVRTTTKITEEEHYSSTQTENANPNSTTYPGAYNAWTYSSYTLDEDGNATETGGDTYYIRTVPDNQGPYFTNLYQTGYTGYSHGYRKLDDGIKVANLNGLNGLLVAEGDNNGQTNEGQQSGSESTRGNEQAPKAETITSTTTVTNSATSQNGQTTTTTTIKYTDTEVITEEQKENVICINKTEDKLVTNVGSMVTIRSRYTAETEGLDLTVHATGTTIAKKRSTYTNTDTSNFLSASKPIDEAAGTHINGTTQQVTELIENKDREGVVKVKYRTDATIHETLEGKTEGYSWLTVYNNSKKAADSGDIDVTFDNTEDAIITYVKNREEKTLKVPAGYFKVSDITNIVVPTKIENVYFYKTGETEPFYTASATRDLNELATIPTGLTGYYAKLKVKENGTTEASWTTEWKISVNDLKSLGLTDTDIENIISIERYQYGEYGWDCTMLESAKSTVEDPDKLNPKISYSTLDIGSFDTTNTNYTREGKTITISMEKDDRIIKGEGSSVVNKNPTFYVKLPKIFRFTNLSVTMGNNPYVKIKNQEIVTIGGQKYLKIECDGTYDSTKQDNLNLSISFTRELIESSASRIQYMEMYMLTENENYYQYTANNGQLTYNSEIPENAYYVRKLYVVAQSSLMQCISQIEYGKRVFKPNTTSSANDFSEKTYPMIIKTGETVNIAGELKSAGKKLSNVELLVKLPVNNSTEVLSTKKLVEDDYTLPSGYLSTFSTKLNNPNNTDGTVQHISRLTNLRNIKVYSAINGITTELDSSRYTILYSESVNAGFDSQFTNYVAGESDASAAVIKIVINGQVESNENLVVKYSMDMPDEPGIVGATFGARYLENGSTTTKSLDSEAVYMINGNNQVDIKVKKLFEGYSSGRSPTGVSLSGIQFKLEDPDGNIVQKDGADYVATTNESGEALFEGLLPLEYRVIEVSTIDGFDNIGNLIYIDTQLAQTNTKNVTNPRKRGTIKIQKKFENTNEIKGKATFKLERTEGDSIYYETTVETDEEGKAEITAVPYGKYKLTETIPTPGYGIPDPINNIVLTEQQNPSNENRLEEVIKVEDTVVQAVEVTNPLGKGTIVINKTVPEGEDVKEIKFQVEGIGAVSYTDSTTNNIVTNDVTQLIDLNQTYTGEATEQGYKITLNITEPTEAGAKPTQATVTIADLPLGLYTISEIVPSMEGSTLKKYTDVTRSVELITDSSTETVNIINRRKTGYLQLHKTAFVEGVNENNESELQEIGDLSSFQVQITGTSSYGTNIDRVVNFDEDGNATVVLEIGEYTVKEVEVDGFDVYYKNIEGNFVLDSEKNGTTVQVDFDETTKKGKTTELEIKNILTGEGTVRVEKSLEGVTDPQKVVDAGIKFRVIGRNLAGGRVEEIISINQIDTVNNVAYGVSNGISVGGSYELEEVLSTVPDYYEGVEARPVTITTNHTETVQLTNQRSKGNLEITTNTDPEGGELFGIKYKVTEVEINRDGTYTKFDGTNGTENTVVELNGSNGALTASFAELREIKAGNYLVELTQVPDGYIKDQPQIVEVPADSTGYAIFTIRKGGITQYNKVIINKQIVKEVTDETTGQKTYVQAEQADFTKAKLDADEGFEVKLRNTETGKEYFGFTKASENAVIADLPAGTYEIEEQVKPKFKLVGYFNTESGIPTTKIEANEQGKYVIQVTRGNSELTNTVEVTIKNKIDTGAGFGGSTQVDNRSKIQTQEIELVTQTIVYVVNEEGNEIPGVRFKLMKPVTIINENNEEVTELQEVNVGTQAQSLVTRTKKITIKGLDVGKYVLVCTEVPEGYLKPKDKELQVYSDVTQVSRIEVQKNVPRGAITLSTTYVNQNGDTRYVPRSKYKVVDTSTGQLVTFSKTTKGDYIKSNLEDATDVITLKSGEVELQGLELGTYEIGLVGVTDGFGMIKDDAKPETITIATANEEKRINVEVAKRRVKQVGTGYWNTMYLDDGGNLWIIGYNYYSVYGDGNSTGIDNDIPHKIEFPEDDVYITSFAISYYSVIAIDSKGRVWSWGSDSSSYVGKETDNNGGKPICLSEIEGTDLNKAYKNGVTITQVDTYYEAKIMLDSTGKVWTFGYGSYGQIGNDSYNSCYVPLCITDIEGNPLYEAYNSGIRITKVYCGYNRAGAIDSLGRVWMWGDYVGNGSTSRTYVPVCISDTDSEFCGVEIVQLEIDTYNSNFALDKEGNVWCWGYNNYGMFGSNNTSLTLVYPTKMADLQPEGTELFGGAKIKYIHTAYSGQTYFIDENSKLWGCGSPSNALLGSNVSSYVYTPICMSDNDDFKNMNIVQITSAVYAQGGTVVLDENGTMYGWGNYNYGQFGPKIHSSGSVTNPQKIINDYTKHLEYNLRFKAIKGNNSYNNYVALDESGNIWVKGASYYVGIGLGSENLTEFTSNRFFEGKKIIDVDANGGMQIALSENGEVFAFGYYSSMLTQGSYTPVDLTNKFELPAGVKIVDVAITGDSNSNSTCIAIDSTGKVWTYGSASYYQLGTGNTNTPSTAVCISDEPTENLYNVKITKIIPCRYGVYAIDDNDKLWYWGYTYYSPIEITLMSGQPWFKGNVSVPTCVTDIIGSTLYGVKFKDIAASNSSCPQIAGLDLEGNLWMLYGGIGKDGTSASNGSSGTFGFYCVNKMERHALHNESQKFDDYKIEKVRKIDSGIVVWDNKGKTWIIPYDSSKETVEISEMYSVPSEIMEIDNKYLIDVYGQIWEYSEASSRSLTANEANPLYNVKVKEIINADYTTATVKADTNKGEIYEIDSTSITFKEYGEEYIEKYIGKRIIQIEKGKSDNKTYNVVLDEDGKIWTWGAIGGLGNNTGESSTIPVCLSTVEGTDFYNAYHNSSDSNFKITKIFVKVYISDKEPSVYAIDNNGKLWIWGYLNYYNQVSSPVCLNNIEGSQLYYTDSTYKIERIISHNSMIYMLGSDGEIWMNDSNQGVIKVTCDEARNEQNVAGFSLHEFSSQLFDYSENYHFRNYFTYNNKLWNIGSWSNIKCLTNIEGKELNSAYDSNFRIVKSNDNYLIDNLGKLWVWGNNYYGQLGNGTTGYVNDPTCISNIDGTEFNQANVKVVEFESLDSYTSMIKDENGKIWVCGNNTYGQLGNGTNENILSPFCISNTISTDIVKIQLVNASYNVYASGNKSGSGMVLIVLGNDGKLYSCGGNDTSKMYDNAGKQVGSETERPYEMPPAIMGQKRAVKTLTEIEDLSDIKDFYILEKNSTSGEYARIAAISTSGIYCWGYNNNGQCSGSSTSIRDMYYPVSLTEQYNIRYYYCLATPRPVTDQLTNDNIVNVVGIDGQTAVLDSSGNVWIWGSQYKPIRCITNNPQNYLYGKDIVGIGSIYNSYDYLTIECSDGTTYAKRPSNTDDIWQILDSDGKLISAESGNTSGEAAGKTIVQRINNVEIDSDGNLYGWNSTDGMYDENPSEPICITNREFTKKRIFNSNQTLINVPEKNELYGNKFADILNDQIVKDVNGDYWFFPQNDSKAINISKKSAFGYDNPLYGKTIVEAFGSDCVLASDNKIYNVKYEVPTYVMDYVSGIEVKQRIVIGSDNYCVLDTTGKIWTCGKGSTGILGNGTSTNTTTPICINNVEGTALYQASNNSEDPNFKIEKLYNYFGENNLYAVDSNGKLWSWGENNEYGILGNNTTQRTNVPICLNNISGTDLANSSNTKVRDIVYLSNNKVIFIDTDGKVWVVGRNYVGELGIGISNYTITTMFKCASDVGDLAQAYNDPDFKIESIKMYNTWYHDYDCSYLIDNKGKVWMSGSNATCQFGDGAVSEILETHYAPSSPQYGTYKCISNSAEFAGEYNANANYGIKEVLYRVPGGRGYTVLLDTNGKLWRAGYAEEGNGKFYIWNKFKCMNTEEGTGLTESVVIEHMVDCNGSILLLDSTGKIWAGNYSNSSFTENRIFECISNKASTALNTAYTTDNNFKIEKIISGNNCIYLIDNKGKLWAKGTNTNGRLGDGTAEPTNEFKCVSNISTSPLYEKHQADSNFKVVDVLLKGYAVVAIDNTGNTTMWDKDNSRAELKTVNELNERYTTRETTGTIITEVLDETHVKSDFDEIYELSSDGTITRLDSYTPGEPKVYEPVTIPGVNVVDYSTYKALDDKGNLYVWSRCLGGMKSNINDTSAEAVNITEEEYFINPIYTTGNGWTAIKELY